VAYFQRLSTAPDGGGRFRATEHTGGGWNPAEQHIAPTIGLVTHCLVTAGGGAPVQRLAVDILGVIGIDEVEVTVATGRAQAWLRSRQDLVEDEEVGGLARFLTLADTANGLVQGPERRGWFYPNVDLTAHLFREPTGPWVGMDTTVSWGPGGHGLTATVLHDDAGPVGRVAQLCTLRRPAG
jgi:hypothetical protein